MTTGKTPDEFDEPTRPDIIARSPSSVGEFLKMMGAVDDATLIRALEGAPKGERLGERLLAMGAVTAEQLDEALELQAEARGFRPPRRLPTFLASVRARAAKTRETLFAAIPTTNSGEAP